MCPDSFCLFLLCLIIEKSRINAVVLSAHTQNVMTHKMDRSRCQPNREGNKMGRYSALLIFCVAAFAAIGCGKWGGSSKSGKAQYTLKGTLCVFDAVEFRIDVNPRVGMQHLKNEIEPGKPQPIRYILQSKGYPKHQGGKGFLIAWWIDGDDPMEVLKGLVGRDLTCNHDDIVTLHYMLEVAGQKDVTCDERFPNRFTIDRVTDDMIFGTFGGEVADKGPDGYIPVKLENGSFEASITKMFVRKE